jgi:O-antigen biosynthesis protein
MRQVKFIPCSMENETSYPKVSLAARLRARIHAFRERRRYRKWMRTTGRIDPEGVRRGIASLKHLPLVSVLLPVHETPERLLRKCLDSVFSQIYPHWELCIADDHSASPHVRRVLEEFGADPRVKLAFREANGHIAAASNSALAMASGELAALLDHDDELAADALYWLAREVNEHPDAAIIYSDEDVIDERGRRSAPKFKPDWSRDLFYSVNFTTHLSAFRTDLVRAVGGFRLGSEGSQDYDLVLRLIEEITDDRIRHIPRVLYHWRTAQGSVASDPAAKPYAHERARMAIAAHLERSGAKAAVVEGPNLLHRVRYAGPEPSIAVLVHGEHSRIEGLQRSAGSQHAEFIAVGVGARAMDEAARGSAAEIICFIEGGLRPASDGWLAELAAFALQPGIGAVGGKVLAPDGTVAAGGYLLGTRETVSTAHYGLPFDRPGNLSRNILIGNYLAVSCRLMAMRRQTFIEAGGFDHMDLPESLFDVDLCLRLYEQGLRIVFDPFCMMIAAASRRDAADEAERAFMQKKWARYFERDPFRNPNLSANDGSFSIKL